MRNSQWPYGAPSRDGWHNTTYPQVRYNDTQLLLQNRLQTYGHIIAHLNILYPLRIHQPPVRRRDT